MNRFLPDLEFDFAVIGSGVAGLFAALTLARETHGRIGVFTKGKLIDGNSSHAQGGIATAWADDDDPDEHAADTLSVGAGLNLPDAVNILVHEGPVQVRDLISMGTRFDADDEQIRLTREGGHSRRRVLHALGDATGREIVRALVSRLPEYHLITVHEDFLSIDLERDEKRITGFLGWNQVSGQIQRVRCSHIILATGGAGALFPRSTNPAETTGDGMCMAWAAGATLADLEFIQFHPTALVLPNKPSFLITEALRGEGGILRNHAGEAFMARYHAMKDLAPRDIVARAMVDQMNSDNQEHVFLDARHLGEAFFASRFPSIFEFLRTCHLNPGVDLIPVAPAAHYFMGGVTTDLEGRTTIPGLYAAGEVACTGVHGANRLASNSLLECVVFGQRAAHAAAKASSAPRLPGPHAPVVPESWKLPDLAPVETIRKWVGSHLGISRTASGLECITSQLSQRLEARRPTSAEEMTPEKVFHRNLAALAGLIGLSASTRQESRGAHYRLDFPHLSPAWQGRIFISGTTASFQPLTGSPTGKA